jgi:hypothetical protein
LTKAVETIITEDSDALLCKHIAELEMEKSTLQCIVDNGIEDYILLMTSNACLLAECNDFRYRCEDLEKELVDVRSDTKKRIADLEAKVKSAKAHRIDVVAASKRQLRDFKGRLVRCVEELRKLYVCNVQTIQGLCSQMPAGEPSTKDYLHWLSVEITGLPDMFSGVNENFATAVIEIALTMVEDFVDLDIVRGTTTKSGADILPTEHDVWRVVWEVSKKWWCYFSYDYVLVAIRAKHEKVLAYL